MFGAIVGAVCAIASAAVSVAKTVGAIGLAIEGIKTVVNAIVAICKTLGLIKEDEKPEDLGDKAIQYEETTGKKPEDFDTYEEYVEEVEKFEVDPERSKEISEKDKQLKAAELASGLLLEKYPDLSADTLQTILTVKDVPAEKIAAYIETLKDGKSDQLTNIAGVLTNTEKDTAKYGEGLNAMLSIEKTINPSIDEKQAQRNVMETIRSNAQKG